MDKSRTERDALLLAAGELCRAGVGAPREPDSFEQLGRSLAARSGSRSAKPERRQGGMEDLQTLSELAQELSNLLFWRELRRTTSL